MADAPAFDVDRLRPGLITLLTAYDYAHDCQLDRWQFAVPLSDVLSGGATLIDIRWLILRGFAEHALETTVPGDANRSFRRLPPTCLPSKMCIVLSQQGADALRRLLPSDSDGDLCRPPGADLPSAIVPARTTPARRTPEWDAARRELRYGGRVVKRFRVPAANQERILAAFEEEGWPEFIDDPLPPDGEQEPKRRLQATIKSLNRNQLLTLIRFHGNGSGLQVYWEAVATAKFP